MLGVGKILEVSHAGEVHKTHFSLRNPQSSTLQLRTSPTNGDSNI